MVLRYNIRWPPMRAVALLLLELDDLPAAGGCLQ
jgi:hypothetical protein